MRYLLRHLTHFTYERPVSFARCNLRLKPIVWEGQTLISHGLSSSPYGDFAPAPGGNSLVNVTRLVLSGAINNLDIISTAEVEVTRWVPQLRDDDPSVAEVGAAARASNDVSEVAVNLDFHRIDTLLVLQHHGCDVAAVGGQGKHRLCNLHFNQPAHFEHAG